MSNMKPGQFQIWYDQQTGLEHNVIGIIDGEVATWSTPLLQIVGEVTGYSWFGPIEDFLKQFRFLRKIPETWKK